MLIDLTNLTFEKFVALYGVAVAVLAAILAWFSVVGRRKKSRSARAKNGASSAGHRGKDISLILEETFHAKLNEKLSGGSVRLDEIGVWKLLDESIYEMKEEGIAQRVVAYLEGREPTLRTEGQGNSL